MLDNQAILGPAGVLATAFEGYEWRPQQLKMADLITQALESGQHAAIEAGTGTGKSFAYLAPTILWAVANKKRVVVSTRTKALQEQLVRKDVPMLQQALALVAPFKAEVVKGRGNYVCKRKVESAGNRENDLFQDRTEVDMWQAFRAWYLDKNNVERGERDEMPFQVTDDFWGLLASDADDCTKKDCPFFKQCHFYMARERQMGAHILIANHALFFADILVRMESDNEAAVLADYDAVVLDEAHTVEDVATDFFSTKVSHGRVTALARNIRRAFKEGGTAGFRNNEALYEVEQALGSLVKTSEGFFGELGKRPTGPITGAIEEPLTKEIAMLEERIAFWLDTADTEEGRVALGALLRQVSRLGSETVAVTCGDLQENTVYWVETTSKGFGVLNMAPISLEETLRKEIFEKIDTVVLTSATLSSKLLHRIGLAKFLALKAESPFDFPRQALLYVPAEGIGFHDRSFDEFVRGQALSLLTASQGRALMLFTSYKSMKQTFDALAPDLQAQGIEPAMQGQRPSPELVAWLKEGGRRVLFAVSSFWEGVDIPGDALSLVVLTKLPFDVPTHPVAQARHKALERAGRSPFNDLSLPQAVMRLKQGFGRLIRTQRDRGVVAILDGRIATKTYGKEFLRYLPPARRTGSIEDVRAFFRQASDQRDAQGP